MSDTLEPAGCANTGVVGSGSRAERMASRHYCEFILHHDRYAIARPPLARGATPLLSWFGSLDHPSTGRADTPWKALPPLFACAALEGARTLHAAHRRELIAWLARGLPAPVASTTAYHTHLLRDACDDLRRGRLVMFQRARPLGGWQPEPIPAPLVRLGEERHRFSVCWVDELGDSLAGIPLLFEHAGLTNRQATDAVGIGCVNDSPAASATVSVADEQKLRELLKARWSAPRESRPWLTSQEARVIWLRGDRLPSVDLTPDKVRTVSVQPYVIRTRLLGGFFDSSKSFVLPVGLPAVRAIVAGYAAYPKAALLLVGHTDTAGNPEINDPLSLERAEALKDYLTDNVAGWLKWYGDDVAADKRWGAAEDRRMLGALPDAGSRPRHEPVVRWFQRTRGLAVDGVAGPQTRRALIEQYMALDGTSLPEGIAVTCHGCGENFPLKATGDGRAELDNRRVEAFFFPANPGIVPAPGGSNSKAGSTQYPQWVRLTSQTVDFDPSGDEQTLVLRFPLTREQASQAQDSYILESEDATVRQERKLSSAVADAQAGAVKLMFDGLPDQLAYRLQCAGEQTYTVFDYATLAELKQELQAAEEDTSQDQALACWMPPADTTDGTGQPAAGQEEAVA